LGIGQDKDFRELLSKRIQGQDRAVSQVADRLDLIQKGLVDKNRPPAIFLFTGLTGTGKTELAKEISRVYSSSHVLITYPAENLKSSVDVTKILGAAPGYIGHEDGGKLINDLNRDPYSVVLFDEIEKAHPEIWDPILHLFDEGNITDSKGVTAYGNKAFFILTSNIGYEEICAMLAQGRDIEEIEKVVIQKIYDKKHAASNLPCFRPEFIARILRCGGIVVFNPLSYKALRGIAQQAVNKMCSEWQASYEQELWIHEDIVDYIADVCYEETSILPIRISLCLCTISLRMVLVSPVKQCPCRANYNRGTS
jgi:ATP-dependent Clp protease ATP-binding subunit ClpA